MFPREDTLLILVISACNLKNKLLVQSEAHVEAKVFKENMKIC